MSRVKDDLLCSFFLVCGFVGTALASGVNSGPIDYTTASNNLAQFFILSSNHQPVRSTEDFNKFWGTYTAMSNWNESYSSEWGASVLVMPVNSTMHDSFLTFRVNETDIPQNVFIPRIHYMIGMSRDSAVGGSMLYSPDLGIYGAGVTAEYSLFQIGRFTTGILASYGAAWKSDFMSLSSEKASIVETFNLLITNLYVGFSYIKGFANFVPPPNQLDFGTLSYENNFGNSFFIGFSYLLSKSYSGAEDSMVITTQVDFEQNLNPSLIAKLTMRIPSSRSYSKSTPMKHAF